MVEKLKQKEFYQLFVSIIVNIVKVTIGCVIYAVLGYLLFEFLCSNSILESLKFLTGLFLVAILILLPYLIFLSFRFPPMGIYINKIGFFCCYVW